MPLSRGDLVHPIIVAVDGESKCGKTTKLRGIIDNDHTQSSADHRFPLHAEMTAEDENFVQMGRTAMSKIEPILFNGSTFISAGNTFRAAALFSMLVELNTGSPVTEFNNDHAAEIVEMLAIDGIQDVLQHDQNIENSVSKVGQTPGIQELCGALFCRQVLDAYGSEDQPGKLITIDARRPVDWLLDAGIVGFEDGQIDPRSIMPIYLHTNIEAAASRMGGDYQQNYANISDRRSRDLTNIHRPMIQRLPQDCHQDFVEWLEACFNMDREVIPMPLFVDNTSLKESELIGISAYVATFARDLGLLLKAQKLPHDINELLYVMHNGERRPKYS